MDILKLLAPYESLFNYIIGVVGLIGFVITLVTLIKVRSVAKTQLEERKLVRELYGTETMASELKSAASLLQEKAGPDGVELAEELIRRTGQIEGVTRALEPSRARTKEAVVRIRTGYYTPEFLRSAVHEARLAVDFLIYRNLQFTDVGLLEEMQKATARGVKVRILALTPDCTNAVLAEACRVLPRPVASEAEVLRDQLAQSESRIMECLREWSTETRERFEYRGYRITPHIHLARQDGFIRTGFLGTLATVQPRYYEERPYLEVPFRSKVGQLLADHFEQLWVSSDIRCVASDGGK